MIDLKEETWEILLERIRDKKCTPFLGAGACAGALPLAVNCPATSPMSKITLLRTAAICCA